MTEDNQQPGKATRGRMTREDKIRIATGFGVLAGLLDSLKLGTPLLTNWPLAIGSALASGLVFYAIAGLIWRKPKPGKAVPEKKAD